MKRREFLKLGGASVAATSAAALPLASAQAACAVGTACPVSGTIELRIDDKRLMTVDGRFFNFLAFRRVDVGSQDFTVPGPVLRIVEGQQVTIKVRNDRPEDHGFHITGVPSATIPCIATGETRCVTFTAPAPGTYIYYDGSHAGSGGLLYRVLGLHGALVVHPADGGLTAAGSPTPYNAAQRNAAISALFDAFGTTERFPGSKWRASVIEEAFGPQEKIWLVNQIDPRFNALIGANGITASSAVANMAANFVPRYFTMNGRSGFDLTDGADVVAKNPIGKPTLLRVINAGLCYHSTHIHGNHLMELSEADLATGAVVVLDNIMEVDVWRTWPMQRRDMLLPFEQPPDIPFQDPVTKQGIPLQQAVQQEPFPLRYVMHCHTEMSQTAAGGNYPQGLVTHWEIEGPVEAAPAITNASLP